MTAQNFTTEELKNEIWRDVVGYEGVYSVSDLGNQERTNYKRKLAKRWLEMRSREAGESMITLRFDCIESALAFCEACETFWCLRDILRYVEGERT